jgi:hypothetical protein
LLPEYARDSFSANESGNSLLITATQSDIRRMVEIIKALDDSISGTSNIKVYPLRFADSKEVANAIKELFPAADDARWRWRQSRDKPIRSSAVSRAAGDSAEGGLVHLAGRTWRWWREFRRRGRGGRGGGGTAANIRVNAVPDEHSNSVIVERAGGCDADD